jgi:hypothetical protein
MRRSTPITAGAKLAVIDALKLDGMRRSTPITAGAKLAVIDALKGAISEDEEVAP